LKKQLSKSLFHKRRIKEVPALHFLIFDTSIKGYRTITQGPFAIKVTAPSPDQEFKAVGFSDVSKGSLTTLSDQFSFRKMFNKAHKFIRQIFASIFFWVGLGIILVATLFYSLWRRFQDRLRNDPAFARRLKACQRSKAGVGPGRGIYFQRKTKDFYALLSKVFA